MKRLHRFHPQTLLVRTFLLLSALIFVSVATWLTLFGLAEREPRAQHLAQLTVSIVNLTHAALLAAEPAKRIDFLLDLAETEGVHVYPAEPDDVLTPLPDTFFFRTVIAAVQTQLGAKTRFAGSVNGEAGLWVSFLIGDTTDDDYWLVLPEERTVSEYPLHWLGWGGLSFALALAVAWLIVSRVTRPLRTLAAAARVVGSGQHPEPVEERGALELRELADAFNRMSDDLRRINAERAEVLAGISHDLRTPLARLRLESELSIADPDARDAVVADIEQMDAIIAQFLDYARSDNTEAAETCDLTRLIRELAARRSRTVEIELRLAETPPLAVYPKALARAITNLVENARKYAGTPIEIETASADGFVRIDVLDRGPGIPEAETERLKRPFTRLEHARTDTTGTGLGLAIVDRIARLHGGHFDLVDRTGGGLIARLRLPLNRPAA